MTMQARDTGALKPSRPPLSTTPYADALPGRGARARAAATKDIEETGRPEDAAQRIACEVFRGRCE
eukprot:scaffold36504_cov45-Phaeocystis_antarctica.AAC.1